MIAIGLSKQPTLDTDRKVIQRTNFTRNLDWTKVAAVFVIIEKAKGTILYFSQGTVKVLWMSSDDLACVAHVPKASNHKVFYSTACSTILFCSI